MKSFAVIGCGRFGTAVAKKLYDLGNEVLAIDKDAELIKDVAEFVTYAVEADVMDEVALKDLGLGNMDAVVVSIGSDIQASVMATLITKELGVKMVISKAHDELHAKILKKIGADRVVFPERDVGRKVARNLTSQKILDYIDISPEYSIVEIEALKSWVGRPLRELKLRNKHGINVIAIKGLRDLNVSPTSEDIVKEGDIMIILGTTKDVEKVETRIGSEK